MMFTESSTSRFAFLAALGAVWGLSEVVLGIGLHTCAQYASGSIMTGVALFFIAAGWALTKNARGPLVLVAIASLLKLFDALLLGLPIRHGAVANPIFAFWTEGLAFLVFVVVLGRGLARSRVRQALTGGLSALAAVSLFPLVKFATTIPACVYPGTTIPLSIYYAPLAVVISLVTVPLGLMAGTKLGSLEERILRADRARAFRYVYSPAAVLLSLLLILLVRII